MKVSRTVSYALQAAVQLAELGNSAPVPSSRLAAEGKMPERFLSLILRDLVTHGILESACGVQGGYRLGRPPEDISLLEVIEAVDGPLDYAIPVDKNLEHGVRATLESALARVSEVCRGQLAAIKLCHLLPEKTHRTKATDGRRLRRK